MDKCGEAGSFFLRRQNLCGEVEGLGRRGKESRTRDLVGEVDRLRRGGEAGGGGLPFSPFRSGWLPACVSGCVVTFDPGAGGLQCQRQL